MSEWEISKHEPLLQTFFGNMTFVAQYGLDSLWTNPTFVRVLPHGVRPIRKPHCNWEPTHFGKQKQQKNKGVQCEYLQIFPTHQTSRATRLFCALAWRIVMLSLLVGNLRGFTSIAGKLTGLARNPCPEVSFLALCG